VSQTVDGNTTDYALDIAGGLTQVLVADDEHPYLYGVRRIDQKSATSTDYFGFTSQSLTDALGSVRQLADADGQVSLAKIYKPYGEVLVSSGEGATSYGFAIYG
jgi:hypothetical protein